MAAATSSRAALLQNVKTGVAFRRRRALSCSTSSSSTATGYQSIGSFHNADRAELMSQSDAECQAPKLPFVTERSSDFRVTRHKDFMIDARWTFLNHGAFGAALRDGHTRACQWRQYAEAQPLRYHDRLLLPHLAHSARLLASFLGIQDKRNVALVPNVTAGMNAILASHVRRYGRQKSRVILWDVTYGSVKKMAAHYFDHVNVMEVPLLGQYGRQLANGDNDADPANVMVRALQEQAVAEWRGPATLLIVDQVTSNTALIMPVLRLSRLAKQQGWTVAVDGAHGALVLPELPLEKENIDYYVTNGHKWLCTPRGVALLYAAPPHHTTLRPPVVSHGVDAPDLFSRFVWDGNRDYAAALSVPVVLDHWQRFGDHKASLGTAAVRRQCRTVLRDGLSLWVGSVYGNDYNDPSSWPGHITLCYGWMNADAMKFNASDAMMVVVKVPVHHHAAQQYTSNDAKAWQDALYAEQVEVPVKCIRGELYLRLSCHVYNTVADFAVLADRVQKIQAKIML